MAFGSIYRFNFYISIRIHDSEPDTVFRKEGGGGISQDPPLFVKTCTNKSGSTNRCYVPNNYLCLYFSNCSAKTLFTQNLIFKGLNNGGKFSSVILHYKN